MIKAGGSDLLDMQLYMQRQQQQQNTVKLNLNNNITGSIIDTTSNTTSLSVSTTDVVELCESDRIATVADDNGELLFNQRALQRYILHCAQQVEGGMRG